MRVLSLIATLSTGLAIGAVATFFALQMHNQDAANQPYADEQGRMISSLSASDVDQLLAGQGWGLAKPAEFNGYPGPAHVIEFKDQLKLSPDQLARIEQSFENMRERARSLGADLVKAEAELDEAFRSGAITEAGLASLLADSEAKRGALRNVHLAAHLEVTPLLTEQQKDKYASLRGYGDGHSGHGGH
jgi:Spy/CpxP family protein refolding chaperone